MKLDPATRERRGLPITDFLYTLDQVCHVLSLPPAALDKHVRFLEVGGAKRNGRNDHRMRAVKLRPTELHDRDEWRVPESELIKYMKQLGLVVYERKVRA